MPTYETEPRHLREAIWSVTTQEYPNWELVIVDDGSTNRSSRRELARWGARDERIVVRMLDRNSGISAATNEAIEHCRGELVAFLDHDDALTADALLRMAHAFGDAEVDVAYSDQDKITERGRRTDPFFKPDWSPVYALGAMYVGHLLVARRELIREAGGLDPEFDGIQDFELLLRMSERTDRVRHVERVLYHWRAIAGSVALDPSEKHGIDELQARAVNEHLRRRGIRTPAVSHDEIEHRVRLEAGAADSDPSVSVVIPTRDGKTGALVPLLERTSYPRLEVIVVQPEWVHGNGAPIDGLLHVRGSGRHVQPGPRSEPGGRKVERRVASLLGTEDGDHRARFDPAAARARRAAGRRRGFPALTRPDGQVDEAGLAIGLYDPVVPAMEGFPADSDGYYGSLSCAARSRRWGWTACSSAAPTSTASAGSRKPTAASTTRTT